MKTLTGRSAALLVLLSVATIGCARPPAKDFAPAYGRAVRVSEERYTDLGRKAENAFGGGTSRLVNVYRELLAAAEETRDDVATLRPPSRLTTKHARLRALLDEQVELLRTVVRVAEEGESTELTPPLRRLADVMAQIQAAHDDIRSSLKGAALAGGTT